MVWAVIWCGFLAVTLSVFMFSHDVNAQGPASKMPSASHQQVMTYAVYAGGINAVNAELTVTYESPERYEMFLSAATRGFLKAVAPWSGTFESNGWRMKEGERPELHKSVAIWRDEREVKEYNYGKDGSFKSLLVTEAGKDITPKELEEDLVQGTTDALTATLEVMKTVASDGKCEGSSEVFDGKRRFHLIYKHTGEEDLNQTRYNVYQGPTVKCIVEVKPISGAWHSKPRGWLSIQEQGREKGTLPTVWFAKMSDDGPAVPVKLRIKTDYGTLFSHLIGYKNGNQELTLQ